MREVFPVRAVAGFPRGQMRPAAKQARFCADAGGWTLNTRIRQGAPASARLPGCGCALSAVQQRAGPWPIRVLGVYPCCICVEFLVDRAPHRGRAEGRSAVCRRGLAMCRMVHGVFVIQGASTPLQRRPDKARSVSLGSRSGKRRGDQRLRELHKLRISQQNHEAEKSGLSRCINPVRNPPLLVPPDLDRGQHQDHREQRQQDGGRDEAEQPAADEAADDRAGRHHQDKAAIFTEDDKAAITAIAGKANQHGRQAHRKGQTASKLDIDTKEQNECRDQ